MHFTGDISLGSIVTVITLIGIALRIGSALGVIKTTLADHARRLELIEHTQFKLINEVQRMIGRCEILHCGHKDLG